MDPDIYLEPEKFDGFRFVKQHSSNNPKAGGLQYAASNLESMAFGYGRHACPGRFFASNEIKMIIAYLLLHYDFRFPDHVKTRPQSMSAETQYLPDHGATVLVRKRAR